MSDNTKEVLLTILQMIRDGADFVVMVVIMALILSAFFH